MARQPSRASLRSSLMAVIVSISEADRATLKKGMRAVVHLDAFPSTAFRRPLRERQPRRHCRARHAYQKLQRPLSPRAS